MDVNSQTEKSCTALALLFQQVISDMKNGTPVWEDFMVKATKLHSTLRSTVAAATLFLEAFQRVADMATNTRGATRDIGSALTRLCMRHRSIENKLKTTTSAIMDAVVMPLQGKMEDWKRVVLQLEKDRNRETKKSHQEIKKALSETQRLQKKLKKGRSEVQKPLAASMKDLHEKLQALKENEKSAVRAALVEERARYCLLIQCIKPFIDGEISLLGDVVHLQEIMDSLTRQAVDPIILSEACEQIIVDICESATSVSCQAPSHQSPTRSMSSSKSSLSSLSSSSSQSSSLSPCHRYQPRTNSESFADSLIDVISEMPSGHALMTSSIYGHWPGSPPLRVSRQWDISDERPHTISSAYERNHARAALCPHTFQPPSSQVSSVPTTPNPLIASTRSVRSRPHSLVRNFELAELFDKSGRRDEMDLVHRGQDQSSMKKVKEAEQLLLRRKQLDKIMDMSSLVEKEVCSQPVASEHAKVETGKESLDGGKQSINSRSIHHSFSCSIISSEPLSTANNDSYLHANGNIYEHIYSEVPRRSSMLIPDRPTHASQRSSFISRAGVLKEESVQAALLQDQQRSGGTQGRQVVEMNLPSGQPHQMQALWNEQNPDGKDFLATSLFQPPDYFKDEVDPSLSTCFVDQRVPQNFAIRSRDTAERKLVQSWNTDGPEKEIHAPDREYFDERLRNTWQGLSVHMTMPSPDDITPTNENQPNVFEASQKAAHIAENNDHMATLAVTNMEQMETGPARESSL